MLRLNSQGRSKRHKKMSLILVELHDVLEKIILPCFGDTFAFSRKENELVTTSSSLHDFRIKSDLKMQKIGSTGEALFSAKRDH
jgi:hypothetical protein